MALILKLISPGKLIDGQLNEYSFDELGGSIGRKPGNDFVLLDPERYISGKHALIDYRNGRYYITDTSTNGVYLNNSKTPLGSGNSSEIMNGDKITIGNYQLLAHISAAQAQAAAPWQANDQQITPPIYEDPLENLFKNAADLQNDHVNMLDSVDPLEILGGKNQFSAKADEQIPIPSVPMDTPTLDDLFGETEPLPEIDSDIADEIFSELNIVDNNNSIENQPQPVTLDEQFAPPQTFIPEDWDILDLGPAQQSPVPPLIPKPDVKPNEVKQYNDNKQTDTTDGNELLDAFFSGCNVNPAQINAADRIKLMHKLGELTRITTHGLMQALQARSTIKSSFRVNKTIIAPAENNPLKFSVTDDEALNILLSDDRKGYMPAKQAFEEGFKDLQSHQLALMAGLQATISTIISQFNPDQLEGVFDTQASSGFLPGQKKSRNWEQYTDFYNRLSSRLQDDFQNIYGEEFARAYEEQVNKLNR